MSKIGASELGERLDAGDVFVLDVRPRTVYQQGHIEGSHNAPVYDELRRGEVDALDDYLDDIPDNREVVTVCKAGVVARKATSHLADRGYDATTLSGGYMGWRQYEKNTVFYRIMSLLGRLVP